MQIGLEVHGRHGLKIIAPTTNREMTERLMVLARKASLQKCNKGSNPFLSTKRN